VFIGAIKNMFIGGNRGSSSVLVPFSMLYLYIFTPAQLSFRTLSCFVFFFSKRKPLSISNLALLILRRYTIFSHSRNQKDGSNFVTVYQTENAYARNLCPCSMHDSSDLTSGSKASQMYVIMIITDKTDITRH
jgi:hypothetical protein